MLLFRPGWNTKKTSTNSSSYFCVFIKLNGVSVGRATVWSASATSWCHKYVEQHIHLAAVTAAAGGHSELAPKKSSANTPCLYGSCGCLTRRHSAAEIFPLLFLLMLLLFGRYVGRCDMCARQICRERNPTIVRGWIFGRFDADYFHQNAQYGKSNTGATQKKKKKEGRHVNALAYASRFIILLDGRFAIRRLRNVCLVCGLQLNNTLGTRCYVCHIQL